VITLCERGSIKARLSLERFPAKPNIHEMGSNILPNGKKGREGLQMVQFSKLYCTSVQDDKNNEQWQNVKRLDGRCLSVWGPEPNTPYPYTQYTCIQYTIYNIQYTYSHWEGEEGERVEPERGLEGQQFTKLGRKIPI
jgi:hypothetical protein